MCAHVCIADVALVSTTVRVLVLIMLFVLISTILLAIAVVRRNRGRSCGDRRILYIYMCVPKQSSTQSC